MPLTAQADCTLECAAINTKIVFCGNIKNGFQNTMPVIGVDSQLDNCLCTQENVRLYRSCLGCENLDTAANISAKFVSDCKITNPSRILINGAFSRLDSLPSVGVNVVALIAVVVALTV
ncbi:hypothetical protein BGX21_011489 [Mortierella sp. AD011]|nr:hypothetical protein BGX20_009344 [Mortierella sp. AD010]KAF9390348.1 hypothetical protein BGX21_011489 [Mortierella sp. AD011]